MAELADATVLGAVFVRSAGSSPVIRSNRQYSRCIEQVKKGLSGNRQS